MLSPTALLAITALLSLMMLFVIGSLLRSRVPGVREWVWANIGVLGALPLFALRGIIPDLLSIVAANALLMFSIAAYYAGCARFLGRPAHWHALCVAIAGGAAAMLYWRYVTEDETMRVVAVSVIHGTADLAIALLVLRHRPPNRRRYNYWLTGTLALLFGAGHTLRGILFLTTPELQVFSSSPLSIALMTLGAIVMPAMTMAAVLMIHDAMLASAEDAANRDYLTGALSRKHFDALARQEMTRALQRGWPLSLILIDLDHFKHINDTHGHAGGDTVLREFVRMMRANLRDPDVLGRLGGEEFAVLLPATDTAGAMHIADRLRMRANQHLVTGPFGVCHYTISGGIATWHEGETFEQLTMRADRALYAAKISGRNLMLTDVLPADETAPEAG
ncbi:diguanylate cyclase [Pandoraea terrae]|uniref:diguanylate cyclase n=1 Tax=Pandoraea terrae TaxID=1537710 RepID=A0A5E4ZF66_9BURK|nr:GGDEF domain-containing protein [Pandoraea terrae]VVE59498.1 diguanylate cyclase [Pandoraea terrae]